MNDTPSRVAEEIAADQRKERRELHANASALTELIQHPGWKLYVTLIEAVGQNYYRTAMEPLATVMDATKGEFAKGALMGLTLAATLPSAKIREAADFKQNNTEPDEDE